MLTLVAGIDEVGYGPILGPLVVSSSIFLINEDPEDNMWQRLDESVGKHKKDLGSRILVCDSKKAYSRQTGLKHLERTVTAFLAQLHLITPNLTAVLPIITNDIVQSFKTYPWYFALYHDQLPKINQPTLDALTENMKQEGIDFIDFRCICTDVEEFNRVVRSTGNKATVVTLSVVALIRQIISLAVFCTAKKIIIYCDKLGGRTYYRDILETNPNIIVLKTEESSRISKYKLAVGKTGREMDIQFEVGADNKHLPVALASMVGKYIREKVMQHMNDYLIKLQPGLKPTAGYWTDGHRFLRDMVQPGTLMKAGVRRDDFVRIK